jgi:hypothetical protein
MAVISELWNQAVPGASDKYGPSSPVLYAVGADSPSGAKRSYTTVITAIIQRPSDFPGTEPLRVSLVLTWDPATNGFLLVYLLRAFHQGDEWLDRAPVTMERMPVWERYTP